MSKKSSKKMDELFRQGAEKYDFEYNPKSWKEMEELLEKDKRRRVIFWWWFGIAGLLLINATVWFFLKPYTQNTPSPKIDLQKENIVINNKLESDNSIQPFIPIEENQEGFSQENKSFESIVYKGEIRGENIIIENNSKEVLEKTGGENFLKPSNGLGLEPKQILKNQKKEKKIIASDSSLGNSINRLDSVNIKNNTIADIEKTEFDIEFVGIPSLIISQLIFENQEKIIFPILVDSLASDLETENQEEKLTKNNAFLIGLNFAGELSSVGVAKFSKLGIKTGIHIEYRYGNKYSTSIGVNYILKNYEVGKEEYIPPVGFWTNGIAPQSTVAKCNILEVPVLVGYYFKGINVKGLFTNIGLTSYFMLKERYNYFYEIPDPELRQKWGTENTNKHWFGIGHFSMGYNKTMGKRLELQIAPYLKIPITGIGHGKVKLYSVGMDLKFNFMIK